MAEVEKELGMLSRSLISRIRVDLSCADYHDEPTDDEQSCEDHGSSLPTRLWLACPRTLRLTTRPRPPMNPDGTRSRTFNRISRSCDMPSLVLNLNSSVDELSERLVLETLVPLFHKLHPEKSGWNLSLMNLCATNMSLTAASAKDGAGRDISKMFKMQAHVLREWKVDDIDVAPAVDESAAPDERDKDVVAAELQVPKKEIINQNGSNDLQNREQESQEDEVIWQSDEDDPGFDHTCTICALVVPHYAIDAHERFHDLKD